MSTGTSIWISAQASRWRRPGIRHPDVVRAITEQASRFLHISTDYYHEPQVALGEVLASIAPIGDRARTFFSNSGTEAVEAAIKLARYHTKRFNIIAFLGSFHGRTLGSLALTSSRTVQRRGFGPMAPGVFHAPYPNPYRCPLGARDAASCTRECLAYIENQILTQVVSPDEVAAIVVEPIQGEGGYVVPPPEFLQGLAAIAAQHGMLFVVDEVQSGIGRTGKMFAIEHAGVQPDIIIAAKGIASGLPMGVTIAREDVMDWPVGAHSNTFGGNPLACAAALATIKLVQNGLMQNAADMGQFLRARSRSCRAASAHRRCARVRPDDRHRARAQSPDEGARGIRARRARDGRIPARAARPCGRREHDSSLAAAGHYEGAGGNGGGILDDALAEISNS